jgi:hypothetical protein
MLYWDCPENALLRRDHARLGELAELVAQAWVPGSLLGARTRAAAIVDAGETATMQSVGAIVRELLGMEERPPARIVEASTIVAQARDLLRAEGETPIESCGGPLVEEPTGATPGQSFAASWAGTAFGTLGGFVRGVTGAPLPADAPAEFRSAFDVGDQARAWALPLLVVGAAVLVVLLVVFLRR